jgi:cytochrome P450
VRAEEDHQTLSAVETLSLAAVLVLGGSETTTNLIGNAVLALLAHPQQLAQVCANLTLVPNVLEETLRYDNPIQSLPRRAVQEAVVAGTTIPAWSSVLLLVGSANHDERKFPDPLVRGTLRSYSANDLREKMKKMQRPLCFDTTSER